MKPEELDRGVALVVEAHRLGFFGDSTLDACRGYLAKKAEARVSCDLNQLFRDFCHMDELQLAATRKDWDALGSLQRFDDRRIILREISRGNMGVVYQALDTTLDRVVAVKEILPDRLAGGDVSRALQRFEREAKVLAAVEHPAVVRLHEVGVTSRNTPYMVMDYVPGASLRDVIAQTATGKGLSEILQPRRAEMLAEDASGGLEIEQVARWGVEIADGLAACHGKGILHRDVKPGNVLIDEKRRAKLADFGIALDLHAERLTGTGEAVGTPLYMAREMFLGKREGVVPGPTSDVYSLGATLYEALTGRPPFYSQDPRKLLVAIYQGGAAPLRSLRSDVPEGLEKVVLKCLALEPAERYQKASELSQALAAFAGVAQVVPAVPALPAPEDEDSPPQEPPGRVGGAGVVGLVLAALGLILFAATVGYYLLSQDR
jgi:serine/threonine protein kinase